jgi:hypothetical protein
VSTNQEMLVSPTLVLSIADSPTAFGGYLGQVDIIAIVPM